MIVPSGAPLGNLQLLWVNQTSDFRIVDCIVQRTVKGRPDQPRCTAPRSTERQQQSRTRKNEPFPLMYRHYADRVC
jgi:hypothetical protein